MSNSYSVGANNAPTLLILGDSISAAYGMDMSEGWVSLLQRRLQTQGYEHVVVNASISGETTEGGLSRLPALLAQHRPELVIIELGGNDGLRGYPIDQLTANLQRMTQLAQDGGARVLLLPMEIPPNMGPRYTKMFRSSFAAVAHATQAVLGPFLLDKVAVNPKLMQADGIHPTQDAQRILLDNVWPILKEQL